MLVILESPYAGNIERNVAYARAAMRDCFDRGEIPFASHLLYTQPGILDDNIQTERMLGINAGLTWGEKAEKTVVYTDLGFTGGMWIGIKQAENAGRPIEYRSIGKLHEFNKSSKTGNEMPAATFDLIQHLYRQRNFSERTFGPGPRTDGVCDHITKELKEVKADPTDIYEWVDLILLSLDGAWRAGHSPEEIAAAIELKQTKNEKRKWPDWRTVPAGKAIEHTRGAND